MGYKTLSIKEETWQRLMALKMYSSQTFDTIINNLIDGQELKEEVNKDVSKNTQPSLEA